MDDDLDTLIRYHINSPAELESVGSVDELGYYALLDVRDKSDQKDILGGQAPWIEEWLEPGFYIAKIDSDGFVYYTHYDDEAKARSAYDNLAKHLYEKWDGASEGYGACGVLGCADCV